MSHPSLSNSFTPLRDYGVGKVGLLELGLLILAPMNPLYHERRLLGDTRKIKKSDHCAFCMAWEKQNGKKWRADQGIKAWALLLLSPRKVMPHAQLFSCFNLLLDQWQYPCCFQHKRKEERKKGRRDRKIFIQKI